ncbi:MAG: phosphoglucomutase/phosphomannomutase family protein, partial [Aquificota bacterium]|nr:phosphoglucomutase/phosphomannomutase family protein [Aquificota bacterium]
GLFRERELLVVHDAMHGTSAPLMREALEDTRVSLLTLRGWRDPLFGGTAPEPVEKNLGILRERVRSAGAHLGIANDGDGDRVAFVDERGNFVNSQLVFALLVLHLLRDRGRREGVVVKTVSTTFLANRICSAEGVPIREVPVGFKNINEVILRERVIFGGEESGGYGFPSFLPERDGLLSALMVLEMMLLREKPLSEIISDLFKEFGEAYYRRVDLPADEKIKAVFKEIVHSPPSAVGGKKVRDVNTSDGLKLIFEDDGWLLMRPSGTEPLIRVYGEAPSEGDLDGIIEGGKSLLGV